MQSDGRLPDFFSVEVFLISTSVKPRRGNYRDAATPGDPIPSDYRTHRCFAAKSPAEVKGTAIISPWLPGKIGRQAARGWINQSADRERIEK